MYGLVNRVIEDMVRQNYGDTTWQTIAEKAGVEDIHFVSLEPYPDEITYDLVGAASSVLSLSHEAVLEAIGEYWVLFTGRGTFPNLMAAAGGNLREFLGNLNNLHMRLGFSMPHLTPPSFNCTEDSPNVLRVHYYSFRTGLAPMVVGLLIGLSKMFNESVEVRQDITRDDDHDHDEFTIRWI